MRDNMTNSEAVEKLKNMRLFMQITDKNSEHKFTEDDYNANEMAINALEKQISKKPILKNGESGSFVDYEDGHGEYKVTKWQDWVCPICGWFVGQRYNRSQNHSHDQRKCNYCNECGQKLDWSDED